MFESILDDFYKPRVAEAAKVAIDVLLRLCDELEDEYGEMFDSSIWLLKSDIFYRNAKLREIQSCVDVVIDVLDQIDIPRKKTFNLATGLWREATSDVPNEDYITQTCEKLKLKLSYLENL